MAKAIVKLFRDPEEADNAIKGLLISGFDVKEIGVILHQGENIQRFQSSLKGAASSLINLPEIGPMVGIGSLAMAIQQSNPESALIQSLNLTKEAYDYYTFGITTGGILISIQGLSDDRLKKAQNILRSTTPKPQKIKTGVRCPAFTEGDRMNATNPNDASLSGDFRKY